MTEVKSSVLGRASRVGLGLRMSACPGSSNRSGQHHTSAGNSRTASNGVDKEASLGSKQKAANDHGNLMKPRERACAIVCRRKAPALRKITLAESGMHQPGGQCTMTAAGEQFNMRDLVLVEMSGYAALMSAMVTSTAMLRSSIATLS